jgi:hypothetical protein
MNPYWPEYQSQKWGTGNSSDGMMAYLVAYWTVANRRQHLSSVMGSYQRRIIQDKTIYQSPKSMSKVDLPNWFPLPKWFLIYSSNAHDRVWSWTPVASVAFLVLWYLKKCSGRSNRFTFISGNNVKIIPKLYSPYSGIQIFNKIKHLKIMLIDQFRILWGRFSTISGPSHWP